MSQALAAASPGVLAALVVVPMALLLSLVCLLVAAVAIVGMPLLLAFAVLALVLSPLWLIGWRVVQGVGGAMLRYVGAYQEDVGGGVLAAELVTQFRLPGQQIAELEQLVLRGRQSDSIAVKRGNTAEPTASGHVAFS